MKKAMEEFNKILEQTHIRVDSLIKTMDEINKEKNKYLDVLLLLTDAIKRAKRDGFKISKYLTEEEYETLDAILNNTRTEI